jgi:cytochrome bd ubiquinol oxidase subunit II
MPPLGLPDLIAGVVVLALTAYVLLAGADFGGGVWDLLATGPRREQQRGLISHAIAPVWEANHVWLILLIVLLFTCFPPAFSRLTIALHIPLSLVLLGIVLRGSAFIFRSYAPEYSTQQRYWGRVFAIASLVTPVLLGVTLGAITAGQVGPPSGHGFVEDYILPWASPFTASVGGFTLALFAFLAAVYLTLEAREAELQEDFRKRALGAGVAVFITAFLTLLLAWRESPLVWHGMMTSSRALPVQLFTGVVALTAFWGLWSRRYRVARVASAAQVVAIIWGWALAQYPLILPPGLSIHDAAAPHITLKLVSIALGVGAVVLLPSLWYLFRVFKSG